jgi:hypothetical protein
MDVKLKLLCGRIEEEVEAEMGVQTKKYAVDLVDGWRAWVM